jgi:hypothetical protein
VVLVGGVVALAIGFSPRDSTLSVGVESGSSVTTDASGTLFPVSQAGPDRLPPDEAAAVFALGNTGAGTPAVHEGHSSADLVPAVQLSPADAARFDSQWQAAQQAIPQRDTEDEAATLGYVRAAAPAGGIGTHWVLWSQIAKPFDPAMPSMLLFDERRSPAVLVGYSYALQSPTRPEGFAGANDHWHQHIGLCVDNGWVVREQTSGPDACSGTYIAGGDFWMLHAWVVPSWSNRKGQFAPFNPKLCPPIVGTPDVNRCPD